VFVEELARFENSRNVEMSFPSACYAERCPSLGRNEMNLDAAVQGRGDAVKHG